MYNTKIIYPKPLVLGEGPIWEERTQVLYFVDILGKKLFQWDYQSQQTQEFEFQEYISCLALGENPEVIYVALNSGVYAFHLVSKTKTFLCQPESKRNYRFNDGRVDAAGNWWLGSMNNINNGPQATLQADASLYKISGGSSTVLLPKVTISNGIAFNGQDVYYIDSKLNNVRRFRYDSTGLQDETVLFTLNNGTSLDGMCISKTQKLYIANWSGGKILVYDIRAATFDPSIPLPALSPSSCCFGGPLLNELFITTSSIDDPNPALAGVYQIKLTDTGITENKFIPER